MQPRLFPALSLAALAMLAACSRGGGDSQAGRRAQGARRMAERLETIARETRPADHPWRNAERAEELRC